MLQLEDIVKISSPAPYRAQQTNYKKRLQFMRFMEGLYDPPKRPRGIEKVIYGPPDSISSPIKNGRTWWYMPRNFFLRGLLRKPFVTYFFRKV